MAEARIKVLYIAGYERTGSTLMDRILGQLDHFVSCGELRYIWDRGYAKNWFCGQGTPFKENTFWREVSERAFGGIDKLNVDRALQLSLAVDRTRYIPLIVSNRKPKSYLNHFENYIRLYTSLYQGIHDVSDGRVIIDSSKHDSTAYLLSQIPQIDLRVVHLIRDSRAVAFSWQRKKRWLEVPDEKTYLPTIKSHTVAVQWLHRNIITEFLRHYATSYTQVRYEDFVLQPHKIIAQILMSADEPIPALDFIQDGHVELNKPTDTVAGNPMRFQEGRISFKVDDEWRQAMDDQQRLVVTSLTLPLLWRYRYM